MDLRKLKKLIDLVQESGIAELEITEGEEKVRISRGGTDAPRPTWRWRRAAGGRCRRRRRTGGRGRAGRARAARRARR